LADKGTIFLDEIGELDLSCQVKLLRVLQEQSFEPLGESVPKHVDVRVVSATNADLRQMIVNHTFREDLFYRINLITVELPPLRERREDISLLVSYFVEQQCKTNNLPFVECSSEAMDFLSRLPYPGNIRELKNLVDRTILVSGKSRLEAADFENQYQAPADNVHPSATEGTTLEEIERHTILVAIDKCSGNLLRTAKDLGISRQALYRRLEKYHIKYEE
jgi:two-component system NtrC family response regulator